MTINTGKLADSPSVLTKEFHTIYGQAIRTSPIYSIPEVNMRVNALKEEVYELVDAYRIKSLVDIADALGDTLYIAFGTGHAHGFCDALDASFTGFGQSPSTKLYDSFVGEGYTAATVPNLDNPDLPRLIERLTELVDEYEAYVNEHQEDGDVKKVQEYITYIVTGAYYTSFIVGLNLDDILVHIQESNLSKLDENGKPIYREDGKVLKGPNFFKPEPKIEALIQSWGGDTRTLLDIEEELRAAAETEETTPEDVQLDSTVDDEKTASQATESEAGPETAVEPENVAEDRVEVVEPSVEDEETVTGPISSRTFDSYRSANDKDKMTTSMFSEMRESMAADSKLFEETTGTRDEVEESEEFITEDDIPTVALEIQSETSNIEEFITAARTESETDSEDNDSADESSEESATEPEELESEESPEEEATEAEEVEQPKNPEEVEVPTANDDDISDDLFNIDPTKKS